MDVEIFESQKNLQIQLNIRVLEHLSEWPKDTDYQWCRSVDKGYLFTPCLLCKQGTRQGMSLFCT